MASSCDRFHPGDEFSSVASSRKRFEKPSLSTLALPSYDGLSTVATQTDAAHLVVAGADAFASSCTAIGAAFLIEHIRKIIVQTSGFLQECPCIPDRDCSEFAVDESEDINYDQFLEEWVRRRNQCLERFREVLEHSVIVELDTRVSDDLPVADYMSSSDNAGLVVLTPSDAPLTLYMFLVEVVTEVQPKIAMNLVIPSLVVGMTLDATSLVTSPMKPSVQSLMVLVTLGMTCRLYL
eukprot:TRINITY_DN31771_c0_g2_i1.p1 TRINITY_DN31771_c0_g2~~TRINITY_DN31771_c0_g2_i1.p1  ORF type:complete len:237 (-),score=18.05 TRINITY_DN31771_c0_g2_i1:115-825(-)